MVMIHHLFHQRNFILYFLVLLCLMPVQMFVHSEPVEISSFNTKVSSLLSQKIIRNKRIIPVGNVVFDKNSYYILLYVGGIMVMYTCLMIFPTYYRKSYQYLKVNNNIRYNNININNINT